MPPAISPHRPLKEVPSLTTGKQAFASHFVASEPAVRQLLGELRHWLTRIQINPEVHGTVELVLAEALNNIVEHAYSGNTAGRVEVEVWQQTGHLSFQLRDTGHALPAQQLSDATLPDTNCAIQDLPEGGFGWFLITRLTQALSYSRNGNQNILCFEIETNDAS